MANRIIAIPAKCYSVMDIDGMEILFTVESTWEGFEKWVSPKGSMVVASMNMGKPSQHIFNEVLPNSKGNEYVVYVASPGLIKALGLLETISNGS